MGCLFGDEKARARRLLAAKLNFVVVGNLTATVTPL